MPYIKFVNESENKSYDGENGLKNLLFYMFSPLKISEDTKRPITVTSYFCGCEPFIAPRDYESDPNYVYEFMNFNNNMFHSKDVIDIVKHRVISFHPCDYVLPGDVDHLGRKLITFYAEKGYIAAYAVHMDTFSIHCHIAVDAMSQMNGNRFHIFKEYLAVQSITEKWFSDHQLSIDQSISKKESYENTLFGDNNNAYGHISLNVKDQIRHNMAYHNSKR